MTLLAGIVSRQAECSLSDCLRRQIRAVLSRTQTDKIDEYCDQHSYIAKVDIGAYRVPALVSSPDSVSMLAGEPILEPEDETESVRDRLENLQTLHQQWICADWEGLRRSRGSFCAIHYSATHRTLYLIADKLALRPIYYSICPDFVIYASALRILEALSSPPRQPDLRAVTEIALFGYPLADRTPYRQVSVLMPGEVLQISADRVERHIYWHWDTLRGTHDTGADAASELYNHFACAVRLRIKTDMSTVSYLSGGLDSRCIVATLVRLGKFVHTVNCSQENTQDRIFGNDIALKLGTKHKQLSHSAAEPWDTYLKQQVREWLHNEIEDTNVEHPSLVWSGDGGSVALGHVYLNADIVALARAGDRAKAIDRFVEFNKWKLTPRMFQERFRQFVCSAAKRGIAEELERFHNVEPGRALHLFLMFNDQRRHLSSHFENIDLDRFELHLPFYDSKFLASILLRRVDPFLGHAFYVQWLSYFPDPVAAVPWQSYPGHCACPLPLPPNLRYQWSRDFVDREIRVMERRNLIEDTRLLLRSGTFPGKIIRKGVIRLSLWMTRLGIRDLSYIQRTAGVYCRYSGNNWHLD